MKNDPSNAGNGRHESTPGEDQKRMSSNASSSADSVHQENEHMRQDNRLQHEKRDERGYIRVPTLFRVTLADSDTELSGHDVSLGGFSAQSERTFEPGERVSVSLILAAGTFDVIVPAQAECLEAVARESGSGYDVRFKFIEMDPQHRESLRQIIRSWLSGRSPDIEGQIAGEDSQTPRKRKAAGTTPARRPPKPVARYVLLFLAIGLLVLVGAATAYRNYILIEPSFAAVTAPRIDIRAPSAGVLGEHDFTAGDRVERDQLLTNVINRDLESDLILAEAAINYNDQLIDNLRGYLEENNQEISLANSARLDSGDTTTFETVSPAIAEARIEQFEEVRDFENSRIAALRGLQASNEIYSPCNCIVAWALSSAAGVYIDESEPIMTLIRTDEGDVMVEALVHMDDISRIQANQQAYVTLPNATQPIRAQVRNVALDIESQPRAGFPSWVRQQQNMASVLLFPEEPLPPESVGQPIDVRFSETQLLSLASEKIWQGVNSIIQSSHHLYDTTRDGINRYRSGTDDTNDEG
ncbi:PilZ domain-containing protein [Halomonas aquamarina]|uniref:PilZ domain-containing protein n=1 Tax=Vreelandella aquamarina TaxID=77097 RepID=A0ACC5VRF6_9GAMM|nr:HlyD family efflux transporter periplasmic adaptor subunit [Halomonas aquamarina]MBZ5486851.1 PilZ domain-containing protein [Halomonas aquamarina]